LVAHSGLDGLQAIGIVTDGIDLFAREHDLPIAVTAALRDLPAFSPSPQRLPCDSEITLDIRRSEILDPINEDRHGLATRVHYVTLVSRRCIISLYVSDRLSIMALGIRQYWWLTATLAMRT
jgi:hypothetical protein